VRRSREWRIGGSTTDDWWRRWELNPRPMDSPCNLLRAYPAFSFRAAQARRRASRLASSLVFSPPPYEPQGSGTVSFGYAQVSRANSTGRTSPPLSGECQRLSVGSYWVARFVEITRLRSQAAVSTPPSSPFAPTVTRALYPVPLIGDSYPAAGSRDQRTGATPGGAIARELALSPHPARGGPRGPPLFRRAASAQYSSAPMSTAAPLGRASQSMS
jgi:hypothetical protein